MKKLMTIAGLLLLTTGLFACGQSGPLYLPDDEAHRQTTSM